MGEGMKKGGKKKKKAKQKDDFYEFCTSLVVYLVWSCLCVGDRKSVV